MRRVLRILLLFAATPLFSVDLADLFRGAGERDLELKRISLSLENMGIAQARAQAGRGMQLSLDSSGLTFTQELGSDDSLDDSYIAATSGVTLSLGEPFHTRLGVTIPASYSTSATSDGGLRTGAGASITQPINPLLGWTPHAAEDKALRNAREKAVLERKAREAALKREIVGGLRSLAALEQRLFDADASARDLRAELDRTRALQTYEDGSYAMRKLEGALIRLEKEKAQASAEMELRRGNLERKTGVSFGGSPVASALTIGEPQPVEDLEVEPGSNQAVYLAGLNADLASERVKEEGFKDLPTLSVRGGYTFNTILLRDVLTWYHFPSVSVSLSWKIFDNGLSRLNAEALENELAMARIGLQAAEEEYRSARAEILLAAKDLRRRKDLLEEQKALQELELREKTAAFQKGIATEADAGQARTRLDRLSFDELLLRCDAWLLSIQAEALNLAGH